MVRLVSSNVLATNARLTNSPIWWNLFRVFYSQIFCDCLYFAMHYFVSFLVLQSPWRGRGSWLLRFDFFNGCLVTVNVLWLCFMVPWIGLLCVIEVFPDHTHLRVHGPKTFPTMDISLRYWWFESMRAKYSIWFWSILIMLCWSLSNKGMLCVIIRIASSRRF